MSLTSEGAYALHRGLLVHFQKENYDFFKYQGRMRNGSFHKKPENIRRLYGILAKKENIQEFIIANILKDYASVPVNLLSEEATNNYLEYKKMCQSASYILKSEVSALRNMVSSSKKIFSTKGKDGTYPLLLTEFLAGRVSITTMIIIDEFIPYISRYDEKFGKKDFVWGKIRLKIIKLKQFIKYKDRSAFAKILREALL